VPYSYEQVRSTSNYVVCPQSIFQNPCWPLLFPSFSFTVILLNDVEPTSPGRRRVGPWSEAIVWTPPVGPAPGQMRPPSHQLLLPTFAHSHELIRHPPYVVQPQDIAIGTTSANSRVEDCLMRKPVSLSPSQSETPTIPSFCRSLGSEHYSGGQERKPTTLQPYEYCTGAFGSTDECLAT
jgi:hypothetical protein